MAPKVLENFYPCPVCVGIPLEKLRFQKRDGTLLVLDHCKRCQGMWFDYREVNMLRQMPPQLLADKVAFKNEVFMMPCHQCHHLMSREEKACPHCKHRNILDCPVCEKPMKVKPYAGLKLDLCRQCQGTALAHSPEAIAWRTDGKCRKRWKHLGSFGTSWGYGSLRRCDEYVDCPGGH